MLKQRCSCKKGAVSRLAMWPMRAGVFTNVKEEQQWTLNQALNGTPLIP